jgi:hypothetical protein
MAEKGNGGNAPGDTIPPEAVAGGSQWHPLTTAVMIGGALAATAGAYVGTRALARRNGGSNGKVSSVMATAITATDLAQRKDEAPPSAADIRVDRVDDARKG